jgi:hypothetical protein
MVTENFKKILAIKKKKDGYENKLIELAKDLVITVQLIKR